MTTTSTPKKSPKIHAGMPIVLHDCFGESENRRVYKRKDRFYADFHDFRIGEVEILEDGALGHGPSYLRSWEFRETPLYRLKQRFKRVTKVVRS